MNEKRQRMLEEQIRAEIATLITGGDLKDPRIGPFVSVTRVEVARDASSARVLVSTFELPAMAESIGGEPNKVDSQALRLENAVSGLQSAAGFIQAALARRIHTRLTPKLHFIADHGIREGFVMTEKIRSLFP